MKKFLIKKVLKIKVYLLCFLYSQALASTYEFGIVGDGGLWNADSKRVRDSLLRFSVKNLIMPGDNLYSTFLSPLTYDDAWGPWKETGFIFDAVAIGNHHGGYAEEIAYFNMPGEAYFIEHDKLVTFIVLNSDNDDTAQEQAKFLNNTLESITTPFVFLVYHHPSYTLTLLHPSFEKIHFQRAIRPVIFNHRKKITALIVGHEHLSMVAHFNDLPVIVSGSTHEQVPIFPLNYQEGSVTVRTNWFNDHDPIWTKLKIDSDSSIAQLDFMNSQLDNSVCTLYLVTGVRTNLTSNCLN